MLRVNHVNIALIFVVFFWSCGTTPKFTIKEKPAEKEEETSERIRYKPIEIEKEAEPETTEFHNVTIIETVTGIASFYADDFHGNQTANGEIFNMYGISAAHPTYPSGTIVRVTNLSNNKSQILRINDHMPQHPERVIDLSYGAAQKLDMIDEGLAEVKIEVLKWGDGGYKN